MLLGITGFKGSGKSTVASVLMERGFVRMRMAGILKDMLRVLGLDDEQIDGSEKELPCDLLGGRSPRWAMQTLGTEWGRQLIAPDLWVRAMRHKLRLHAKAFPWQHIVIDDIRFPNEAAMIAECGGVMWRVTRTGISVDGHVSESHIAGLPVDHEFVNDGSIDDLQREVTARLPLRSDLSP